MKILMLSLSNPRLVGNGISKLVLNRTMKLEEQGHRVDIAYFRLVVGFSGGIKESYRPSGGSDFCLEVGVLDIGAVSLKLLWRFFNRVPIQCLPSLIYGEIFKSFLGKKSSEYDACHCYHIRTLGIWRHISERPALAIDLIDSYTLNYTSRLVHERNWFVRRLITVELARVEILERTIDRFINDRKKVVLLAVAEEDSQYLAGNSIQRRVIPVGIDIALDHKERVREGERRKLKVVFFGNLDYDPNKTACKNLAEIAEITDEGRVSFIVGGRNASRRLRGSLEKKGIEVVSPVEDMEEFVRDADIAVLPMVSGSGMQSKILEAIAWNCLVVATKKVATPLGLREDEEYIQAETTIEFSNAIREIYEGRVEISRIKQAAVKRIDQFSWTRTVKELISVYDEVKDYR